MIKVDTNISQEYHSLFSCGVNDTVKPNILVTKDGIPLKFINPSFKLNIELSDKSEIHRYDSVVLNADGTLRVIFPPESTSIPGIVECEILILEGTKRTTTNRFMFEVRNTILNQC